MTQSDASICKPYRIDYQLKRVSITREGDNMMVLLLIKRNGRESYHHSITTRDSFERLCTLIAGSDYKTQYCIFWNRVYILSYATIKIKYLER